MGAMTLEILLALAEMALSLFPIALSLFVSYRELRRAAELWASHQYEARKSLSRAAWFGLVLVAVIAINSARR